MGLTKQYLAYHPLGSFNIIASPNVNISFITYDKIDGRYVAVGAAEKIFIWDLRLGEKVLELSGSKEEVTALRQSPNRLYIAAGFSNGVVRIFNLQNSFGTGDIYAQFALHRSGINVLRYNADGTFHYQQTHSVSCRK